MCCNRQMLYAVWLLYMRLPLPLLHAYNYNNSNNNTPHDYDYFDVYFFLIFVWCVHASASKWSSKSDKERPHTPGARKKPRFCSLHDNKFESELLKTNNHTPCSVVCSDENLAKQHTHTVQWIELGRRLNTTKYRLSKSSIRKSTKHKILLFVPWSSIDQRNIIIVFGDPHTHTKTNINLKRLYWVFMHFLRFARARLYYSNIRT